MKEEQKEEQWKAAALQWLVSFGISQIGKEDMWEAGLGESEQQRSC